MPKRNQVRQRSQHARSCTNPTGSYHLKPKKHKAKPEDAACEGSAGMERCSLRFQIPQQHRGRKENTSSELPLLTTRPCCHLTVVPSRALLKSPGNLLALSGVSNKCRKLSMETVQTRGSAWWKGWVSCVGNTESQTSNTTWIVSSVFPNFWRLGVTLCHEIEWFRVGSMKSHAGNC